MQNPLLLFRLSLIATVLLVSEADAQTMALASQQTPAHQSTARSKYETVNLSQLLTRLETTYRVQFNYKASLIKGVSVSSPSVKDYDGRIADQLNALLTPVQLWCRSIDSRTFIIQPQVSPKTPGMSGIESSNSVQALPGTAESPGQNNAPPDRTLSGRVTDGSTSNGLPGVSVVVKGTQRGTTTDSDGKFQLSVPETSSLLVFSFVGYRSQEVEIGNQSTLNVRLESEDKSLDEVVVIGYSTVKKVSLTSAVADIKGTDLVKRTTSNVQQALQGQIPGLTVLDQGAAPGRANMVLRIRGITTLGANEPLVIVDGIEQRLSDINPLDIESVSVLKDASSTAIYGSRAANGVVLVTTKRAAPGKVSVAYSGYYALQKTNNNPVHMDMGDYLRLQQTAWTNSTGGPGIFTDAYISEYLGATDRLKYPLPNTWFDAVLHTAPQINHSLSVSGGSENIQARLSLRYQDQDGIIANSGSKISEIRLNTDYKLSPRLKFGTDINYRGNKILAPVNENNVFNRMLQTSQWTVPRYPDGTYGISSDGHNPLMESEIGGTSKTFEENMYGSFKGEWQILRGLTFSSQLGARFILSTTRNYTNRYEIRDYFNPDIVRKSVPINSLTDAREDIREFTINNLLNYATILGGHTISALAGYSQIQNHGQSLGGYRQGFYSNDVQSLEAGTNDATKNNYGREYDWGLRSYFGRINYAYQDKYLIEVNGRYDGSSRFLGANRYSFFPSVSAGWRLSEEKFWSNLSSSINELKIRASWGRTGNQAVGLYSGLATLNQGVYSFSGAPVQTFQQTTLANQDLTWETTTQSDIGVDAQFLNNRLSLTVDYYHKKTDGILLTLPVPGTLGLLPAPQNAGQVDNSGWEFGIGSRNTFGPVGFNASLNFNINNNNVVNLAGTGPYITGGNETRYITGEGYPINSYWGYRTAGLFQTEEEIKNYPTMRSGIQPGDVKFVDLNEDGKINPEDMTYLGRSFPVYTFGSNLNFTYKGFSLNMQLQGTAGSKARIGGAIIEMGIWGGFTHQLIAGNYWTPENPTARFPRPLKYDLRNFVMSDRDLMNGSYLRLKNIQLAYQIPSAISQKVGINRASLYIATTNLLTFSALNEWNVDPETIPGGRTQQYPQTSVSTLGVTIQF